MSVTAIISGIISIAKAIPVVDKWLDQLSSAYIMKRIDTSRDYLMTTENKRIVLLKTIKNAKDDNERIVLSVMLNDLNKRL